MTRLITFCLAAGLVAAGSMAQAQVRVEDRPQRSEDPLGFYRAKDIIGMTIRSQDGKTLGKIDDLVIDSRTEQVQYFLLDAGTTLKSDGLLIMPFTIVHQHFRVRHARPVKYITVNYDLARLRRAPTITRVKFRTLRDRDVFVRVDKFYNVNRTDRRRGGRDIDRDRDRRDRREIDRKRDRRDVDRDRDRDRDRKRDRRDDRKDDRGKKTDRDKRPPKSLPGLEKDKTKPRPKDG